MTAPTQLRFSTLQIHSLLSCEKCGKSHKGDYASGRFCSYACARSFSTIAFYDKQKKSLQDKRNSRRLQPFSPSSSSSPPSSSSFSPPPYSSSSSSSSSSLLLPSSSSSSSLLLPSSFSSSSSSTSSSSPFPLISQTLSEEKKSFPNLFYKKSLTNAAEPITLDYVRDYYALVLKRDTSAATEKLEKAPPSLKFALRYPTWNSTPSDMRNYSRELATLNQLGLFTVEFQCGSSLILTRGYLSCVVPESMVKHINLVATSLSSVLHIYWGLQTNRIAIQLAKRPNPSYDYCWQDESLMATYPHVVQFADHNPLGSLAGLCPGLTDDLRTHVGVVLVEKKWFSTASFLRLFIQTWCKIVGDKPNTNVVV
jgi:hypothetical protein